MISTTSKSLALAGLMGVGGSIWLLTSTGREPVRDETVAPSRDLARLASNHHSAELKRQETEPARETMPDPWEVQRQKLEDIAKLSDQEILDEFEGHLMGGVIERSQLGDRYDRLVRTVARGYIEESFQGSIHQEAGRFLGFHDWSALEAQLASESPVNVAMRPQLEHLTNKSLELMESVNGCIASNFENDQGIEVYRNGTPHDSSQWVADRGIDTTEGKFRFTSGTVVGDSVIQLHFSSFHHPLLDTELQSLAMEAEAFWVAYEAAR